MNRIVLTTFLIMSSIVALFAQEKTNSPNPLIPLDTEWKKSVYQFSQDSLVHPAWGHEHYERDYLLCLKMAEMDSLEIDRDVLFAATFLHDLGVFSPYSVEGKRHEEASAIHAPDKLEAWGFPMEKIEAVKTTILSHHKSVEDLPDLPEAWLLRDADFLDFRGIIGVARLIAVTENNAFMLNAKNAIESFMKATPDECKTYAAKSMINERVKEMKDFFAILETESFGFEAL